MSIIKKKSSEQRLPSLLLKKGCIASHGWNSDIDDMIIHMDCQCRIIHVSAVKDGPFATPATWDGLYCYEIFQNRHQHCDACPAVSVFETKKSKTMNLLDEQTGTLLKSAFFPIFNSKKELDGIILKFKVVEFAEEENSMLMSKQFRNVVHYETSRLFTRGYVHELNNKLSSILGYTDMLKKDMADCYGNAGYAYEICKATEASLLIAQQLKNATAPDYQGQQAQPVKLQYLLKEVVREAETFFNGSIKVSYNIEIGDVAVYTDASAVLKCIFRVFESVHVGFKEKTGELVIAYGQERLSGSAVVRIEIRGESPAVDQTINELGAIKRGSEKTLFYKRDELSVLGNTLKISNAKLEMFRNSGTELNILFAFESTVSTLSTARLYTEKTSTTLSRQPALLCRILLVDDDYQFLSVMKILAQRQGHSVEAFQNSAEALRYFRKNSNAFDIVFTDLNMPHMSGIELAREILSLTPSLPVVVFTGNKETRDVKKMRDVGVFKVVEKPISKAIFKEIIQEAVANG